MGMLPCLTDIFGKTIAIYQEDWKNIILLGLMEKLGILSLFSCFEVRLNY